jgi:hypothetical protein
MHYAAAVPLENSSVFLGVNGVRLRAQVFGDGPRTLGAIGGWKAIGKVREEPIGLLAAAGRRCIAYHRRRSGESPVDPALIKRVFLSLKAKVQTRIVQRGVNSSQVAEPRIGPRTNLHPPSASGGNMYLQRSHRPSGVAAGR